MNILFFRKNNIKYFLKNFQVHDIQLCIFCSYHALESFRFNHDVLIFYSFHYQCFLQVLSCIMIHISFEFVYNWSFTFFKNIFIISYLFFGVNFIIHIYNLYKKCFLFDIHFASDINKSINIFM